MPHQQVGLWIVAAGFVVILIGLLVWAGGLAWFGHLPGDIRIETANGRIFIPITSMILVSVLLSLIATLVRRFLT